MFDFGVKGGTTGKKEALRESKNVEKSLPSASSELGASIPLDVGSLF